MIEKSLIFCRSASMDDVAVRANSLAYCYQESFTAILRVRSQRQTVKNSESFRNQIRLALRSAMEQARELGYSSELIHLSLFATVAYLDETILNLQSSVFADWSRRPLQEELFGGHTAGEAFFRNLQDLLGRQDSLEVADCLEVYGLCLLLGFKGRYALSGNSDLHIFIREINEKAKRIRGKTPTLDMTSAVPEVKGPVKVDRLSRNLAIAAVCLFLLAVFLFGSLMIGLKSGTSRIQNTSLTVR